MRAPQGGRWPLRPAADCADASLVEAFNAAFADYLIGPPRLALADWPGFLRRQGVQRDASRVVQDDAGRVLGFALVGAHGRRVRLATMALRPDARGRGIAQSLLDGVLDAARRAGAADAVELEVFAQNERALALYRSRGFAAVAALHGHERAPGTVAGATAPAPQPVALDDALAWLREPAREALLPFQASAAALPEQTASLVAWRSGGAQLVWSVNASGSQVQVASLADATPGQAGARALARALARAHPQATLRVPQLQRPELGGEALDAEGWQRQPLWQWLMRLPLR